MQSFSLFFYFPSNTKLQWGSEYQSPIFEYIGRNPYTNHLNTELEKSNVSSIQIPTVVHCLDLHCILLKIIKAPLCNTNFNSQNIFQMKGMKKKLKKRKSPRAPARVMPKMWFLLPPLLKKLLLGSYYTF